MVMRWPIDQSPSSVLIGQLMTPCVPFKATRRPRARDGSISRLSTESVHRVLAAATHNSLISGVDATASSQAIRDVLASVRAGAALR